jgi:hypothetical protein
MVINRLVNVDEQVHDWLLGYSIRIDDSIHTYRFDDEQMVDLMRRFRRRDPCAYTEFVELFDPNVINKYNTAGPAIQAYHESLVMAFLQI